MQDICKVLLYRVNCEWLSRGMGCTISRRNSIHAWDSFAKNIQEDFFQRYHLRYLVIAVLQRRENDAEANWVLRSQLSEAWETRQKCLFQLLTTRRQKPQQSVMMTVIAGVRKMLALIAMPTNNEYLHCIIIICTRFIRETNFFNSQEGNGSRLLIFMSNHLYIAKKLGLYSNSVF